MNAKVKLGGVVTLPSDVMEELRLEPGSEISFGRRPEGGFVLAKVEPGPIRSRAQIREHLAEVAKAARSGLAKEFADMTTDEYMGFIRGD